MKSPYKGLAPYDVADEDNFFGREREKQILIGKIFSYNITLFFAGTGAGKSSLLRAAVTPALTNTHGLDVVYYADWVQDPIAGLKAEIEQTLIANDKISGREVKGLEELHPIVETCSAYASEPLVLIFDQFEELFRYQARSGRLFLFVDQLGRVLNDKDLPLSVVFAVREDFLAELNIFKGRLQGLFDNYYRLERLTLSQAREAIEAPLAKVGFRYEDGLVEQLLQDLTEREQARQEGARAFSGTQEGPGQCVVEPPYLQIVCQKLWESEQNNPQKLIRVNAYTTLQGAEQIVRGHVEQVMEKLTLREQALAFQMFQHLVTSRGTKMAYRDEDLADTLGAPAAEIRPILEHLAGREVRILRLDNRPDGQWYELYHDVFAEIIRNWTDQFREDENRHIYSQIATATREWRQQGQVEEILLKGGILAQAEAWAKKEHRKNALLPEESTFLDLSLKKHYRGVWLQRGIVTLITVIAVIAGVLTWYANGQRQTALRREQEAIEARQEAERQKQDAFAAKEEANRQRNIAQSRQLAAQVNNLPNKEGKNHGLTLLLSAKAYHAAPTEEASSVLLKSLQWSPRLLSTLHGHTGAVRSVAFSPDGTRLVSGSGDHTLRLWDASTGQPIGAPLTGHTDSVYSVAFSPDGRHIVSGSEDETLRLWDASTGEPIGASLTGHTGRVLSVAFSPDGTRIVSGSYDKALRLWDISTMLNTGTVRDQPIGVLLTGHMERVFSVAFSPDGTRIVSGSYDGTLRLWDASTGQPLGSPLTGHKGGVSSVAFSPDNTRIVSGSYNGTLRLWDASTTQPIGAPFTGHTGIVNSVTFSPDGRRIVSGSKDNTLRLWDAVTDQPVGAPLTGHRGAVDSVAFSPDGTRIVSGSENRTLRQWDASTGQPIGDPLTGHSGVLSVAFSPDGLRIVSGSEDKTLRLWDASTGQPIGAPLTGHTDRVVSVAFSQDGRRIVSGSEDDTLRLWDISAMLKTDAVASQPVGASLTGHTDGVFSVAFSPDGLRIVSGSEDHTLRRWDASTGQPIGAPLTGHTDRVVSVAFSQDGRRIVSGSRDKTLRLWDATTGQSIGAPLTGHTGRVLSVAFSPDGRRIVSGSLDNTLRLWDATLAWSQYACRMVNRNLTYDEWQRYLRDEPYQLTCPDAPLHPSVLEEAQKLAKEDKLDAAIALFQQALDADARLDFDPVAEANKWKEQGEQGE